MFFAKEGVMSTRALWSVVLAVLVICVVHLPFARASERDQLTKVTFDQPVEIPGHVLAAGSYWFVRDVNDPDVVRIFSQDWKMLYATELTQATERLKAADDTTFVLAERESSKPEALLKWFFPGETIGHEFLYSNREEKELAQDKQQVVVAAPVEAHAGF
jgi:hypothetical protein